MEPIKPDVKKALIAEAMKAFPGQCPHLLQQELEEKFQKMEKLLTKRFNSESGALPPEDEESLHELVALFRPFEI